VHHPPHAVARLATRTDKLTIAYQAALHIADIVV
jgi:hypothetical protein